MSFRGRLFQLPLVALGPEFPRSMAHHVPHVPQSDNSGGQLRQGRTDHLEPAEPWKTCHDGEQVVERLETTHEDHQR